MRLASSKKARPASPRRVAPQPVITPSVRKARPTKAASSARKRVDFDPGPRLMKYIGFRRRSQGAEVFVRCDGRARYKLERDGDDRIVLHLLDTKVELKNNERALDTSFFGTSVTRVKAQESALGTEVLIDLRFDAEFKVKRFGSTIKLQFAR